MYALNPKTKGTLLQLGQVVNIPNKKYKEKLQPSKKDKKVLVVAKKEAKEVPSESKLVNEGAPEKKSPFINHLVATKETLYSISKKYGVTMETICELNPELKTSNLKKGSTIKLPNKEILDDKSEEENTDNVLVSKVDDLVSNVGVVHKVLPKETLYRISKQYGVFGYRFAKIESWY